MNVCRSCALRSSFSRFSSSRRPISSHRTSRDVYNNGHCGRRSEGLPSRPRRTNERYLHYELPMKRVGAEQVWLAVRDGKLVIVAEEGDQTYGPGSLRGDHRGHRDRELREVQSTYANLKPW